MAVTRSQRQVGLVGFLLRRECGQTSQRGAVLHDTAHMVAEDKATIPSKKQVGVESVVKLHCLLY